MAKKKTSKKASRTPPTTTVRVMNPAPDDVNDVDLPMVARQANPGIPNGPVMSTDAVPWCLRVRAARLAHAEPNPAVRFLTVPVSTSKTGPDDLAVVVRGMTREDAIRDTANHVDADAWIDVGMTRSHETKKAAYSHAKAIAPHIEMLAAKLARGES